MDLEGINKYNQYQLVHSDLLLPGFWALMTADGLSRRDVVASKRPLVSAC
jgi:hypothetical protein